MPVFISDSPFQVDLIKFNKN